MRLKQIKLAGFKSFVDPTSVPFPENLTAIVGPNGCGKSNLIDAVRWVMGESSAKHLRGDSMTDVIFNGSTSRKPVGQASIELVFDNTDGTVQGEYANYAEISIRRTVNRDPQASYYLNGTKCRRKDITDIFLGTGLGPRSYAIIEQGMISRLIESKPQELRIFLEEAAGISKYKERRRETENRIRHTRENMERLADIREELGKQLAHLQRQANAATKYKDYKQQERQLKSELSALKWRKFHGQVETLSSEITKLETELESRIAEQRHADNQIEQTREAHIDLTEQFNAAQGRYYGVGADIARLEQGIAHKKERRGQLNDDLQHVTSSLKQLMEQMGEDEIQIEEFKARLLEAEPELELQRDTVEQAQESLTEIEAAMLEWEQEWDSYNKLSSQNSQKMEVERTRIQHFEKVIERLAKRIESNQQEKENLQAQPIEASMLEASLELSKAEEETLSLSESVEELLDQISELREIRRNRQSTIDQSRRELQQTQSRHISLSALQKAALGVDNKAADEWLSSKNLSENKKLAQSIKVESGWELATEIVLGDYLEAISVDGLSDLLADFEQLSAGKLTLLGSEINGQVIAEFSDNLLAKVSNAQSVAHILDKVKVCESVEEAIAIRSSLTGDQSVITREGFWIGPNWARVAKREANEANVLEREAEIEELAAELETMEAKLDELNEQADIERDKLKDLEAAWEAKQRQLGTANKRYSELRAQVGSQQAKLEQITSRKDTLAKEYLDLTQQLQADEQLVAQSRSSLEGLVDAMADDLEQKEALTRLKDEKRNAQEQARVQLQLAKDNAHKIELNVANLKSEINSVQSTNQRMNSQIAELQSRKITLEENLGQVNSPDDDLQIELESALEKRLESEQELAKAREALEEVDKQIRVFEKQRHDAEQASQSVRGRLERLRMQWSENSTMQKNQAETLSEEEQDIEQILANMEEGANEQEWESRIETIAARIQRLGAINLAAIEEHEQQSERKIYLDAQNEDLEESLQTLEGAIRKIDKETRTRFKETFDKVNSGMKELFPKVFGGGHAYLEMTGEDLLDTGVAVMARPPGKRNSTIHLLSGGEKALTALSLVFSIFRLNPAPFCMLDEVDAPLDDANVGRFCKLVKEMSETVQFIYITHNKVSMEMATALAGVTMQEPGASRLVAVDVDEAAQLITQ
ncbi:chromosome segregation protein SMC [Aliikangiella coralliicola]|uniref:Chromosome partition protein Smc n=1 Tax=Aliikangiella coralliicola TaxID=2592383 RepID=A0A545U4T2_9GAMM|nr:chromosome segregation protein SMC [Aliikangiella coralliicola]TQV84472.1 chromosome segregation protein SMC [Aliikangiella coralliicola]